jgi:thiamine-phosphate pyrophosphorylase
MRRARAPLPGPLLVITDRHQARQPLETIAAAVGRGGGRWLLFRDKDLAAPARRDLAVRLARIAAEHGVALSVSADVELAAAVGAAGVHLQAASAVAPARARLPDAIIGVSAHSVADVAAVAAAGADYVTLSPIFLTGSKPGYGPPLGTNALRAAAAHGIPVLALAGVTAATAGACLAVGARGVAVMGEVMRADDPAGIVRDLVAACEGAARDGAARDDATTREALGEKEALCEKKETGGATPGSSV